MKNYLKLVNFEFNRIAKIYGVLLVIVFLAQISGVIIIANAYLNEANKAMYEEQMSESAFLSNYGPMYFEDILGSGWMIGPITLCIVAVAFYIFLIWYRDWFGKNTFIYRLLMLPTSRLNVFLAKATTILLMTFGFVGFQLIIWPLQFQIFKLIIPKDFRVEPSIYSMMDRFIELSIIFPQSFAEFLLYYGAGTMAVLVIFTGILFERSYRLKGILFGIVYGIIATIVFLGPLLIQEYVVDNYFYPIELLILEVISGMVVIIGSVFVSSYLLRKKIRV